MDKETEQAYQRQRVAEAAKRNIERLVEVNGLDRQDDRLMHSLFHLSLRMFYEGFEVGYGHVLQQVTEQGGKFTINLEKPLFADDGPLSA